MMSSLILGSRSSYRRALMDRLQVPFTCEAPDVDEAAGKQLGLSPQATAQELARRKARAIFERHPKCIVIGCDQVAVLDNQLFDKPGTVDGATAQLRQLRGREHRLITAVTILHSDGIAEFADVTRLQMRNLTDGEISRYVQLELPLDCAGSYKIEGLGITLFERIDSHDQTAIIGLPLIQLSNELRKLGVPLP